jgi:predicted HTH domain antitoxin
MATVPIHIGSDLATVLQSLNQPTDQSAQQLMVLELYRRRTVSSGRAAELLHMSRADFIQYASRLGIPFLDMTDDEWTTEVAEAEKL